MGTELVRHCIKEENMEIPAIPPGFESLASFTLKRVEDNEITTSCSASVSASESQTAKKEAELESSEDANVMKFRRRRPWVNYGQIDNSSGDESDSEQNLHLIPRLPKGVIRGCEECSNSQKVTARWHPQEGCRPDIQDAPVFYPNEEEFEDTLNYIASIRPKAEAYGICRIVPPSSWKPPCPLKEKNLWENSKFITRVQRIDKLQNRESMKKMLKINHHKRKKRRRCSKTGVDLESNGEDILLPNEAGMHEAENFGFEPGPEFSLDTFQKYADDFKDQYFRKNENNTDTLGNMIMIQEQWEPSVENIEGEYWRMIEKPTEEIEVLYGADLETGVFGSGFPKQSHQVGSASDGKYVNSGWNLNNFPRLSGSVLSYESSDISGVLVPWLYIGMCFSSFCWHVEDHHLYSMNYMHWGAPKMWYGVPGTDAIKLEAAMRKHLNELFEEQPDLLHKLVTQLSPSILKSDGVPVYRCVQNPGEFVLTFPRAYHSGFNCGFNCAEAVNVAPVDWLPHGQNAIELYREHGRKTSISHDKLLLGAARDAVKAQWELNLLRKNTSDNLRWKYVCGKDGILSKAFKMRVEMERVRREFLCNSSQALKMESSFDATNERECSLCLFDLHLSAAGCHYCSPDKYACLNHAKQLCSCSWGAKFFLFRYNINELNILVEALEGKLSAVYRWARLDLGLALSSYVSKENLQVPGFIHKVSHSPQKTALIDKTSLSSAGFLKEKKAKENIRETLNSSGVSDRTRSLQKEKPSVVVLALESMKASSTLHKSSHEAEAAKHRSQFKDEGSMRLVSNHRIPVREPSQAYVPNTDNLPAKKPDVEKTLFAGNGDVILLSDDECEESKVHGGNSQRQTGPNDTVSEGNCIKDPVLTTHMTHAAVMGVADSSLVNDEERVNSSSSSGCVKGEELEKGEAHVGPNPPNLYGNAEDFSCTKQNSDCNMENAGTDFQPPQPGDNGKPNNEVRQKTLGSDATSKSTDNIQSVSCNTSCAPNNLDRYFRQKGPRMAKVVRRINCNVEPLEFGVVHSGKLWCDTRAIYPKGFRSRVRYTSILDPTNMCYYVSEILDAGRDRPLFMVSLEHCPNEIFAHISAARCWEMVRERVNQEIMKQHKLGRIKLPPLQPPGSLDGMEMFGFSSPAIVQVIQGMDRNRICTEYWKSRPLMQIPEHPHSEETGGSIVLKSEIPTDHEVIQSDLLPAGVGTIITGLFKKANLEELNALYSILSNHNSHTDHGLVTQLLREEICKGQT